VEQIESRVPAGSMIFQMPYLPFPEGPPGEMAMLRGYLHSRSLRWSFGAMTGRETDKWYKQTVLAETSLPGLISLLQREGFKGLFLDRQLFRESDKIEAFLKQSVDAGPITSADGRFVFFSMMNPGGTGAAAK
jgi:phosphoglycerol transferase